MGDHLRVRQLREPDEPGVDDTVVFDRGAGQDEGESGRPATPAQDGLVAEDPDGRSGARGCRR